MARAGVICSCSGESSAEVTSKVVLATNADVRAWIVTVIGHHVTEITSTPAVVDSPL